MLYNFNFTDVKIFHDFQKCLSILSVAVEHCAEVYLHGFLATLDRGTRKSAKVNKILNHSNFLAEYTDRQGFKGSTLLLPTA